MMPAPFIVGVGRSGTTLLRLMLDAHPALAIPGETHFLHHLARQGEVTRAQFMEIVTKSETWENFALNTQSLAAAVDALEPFSPAEAIRAFYRLYASGKGKQRWGDKTGFYLRSMDAIQRLLPEAHFIHVIRDGRDNALSRQGLWFGPGDDFEALARLWVDGIQAARAQAGVLAHYREVRFETLVARPKDTLERICADLDLAFDPAMLDYHETASERLAEYKRSFGPVDRTPSDLATFMSIHERAQAPLDETRIGRWRSEMKPEDRARYEAIAGPLLRELGYEI
jgi:hypothetical protein